MSRYTTPKNTLTPWCKVCVALILAFFDDVLKANEGILWHKNTQKMPTSFDDRMGTPYAYSLAKGWDIPESLEETIQSAVSRHKDKSGAELSVESHNIPAWKYSEPNEPIYITELAAKDEAEYFALIDFVESLEENEDAIPEELHGRLSQA